MSMSQSLPLSSHDAQQTEAALGERALALFHPAVRAVSGGLAPLASTLTADEVENEILYNRRYSLLFEGGHRWIDVRRFDWIRPLAGDYAFNFDKIAPLYAGNPSTRQAWTDAIARTRAMPRQHEAIARIISAQQEQRGAPPGDLWKHRHGQLARDYQTIE